MSWVSRHKSRNLGRKASKTKKKGNRRSVHDGRGKIGRIKGETELCKRGQ